jgi:hypothetical protein
MDANRFDHISRSFAERTTRRNALRGLGGSGLVAAVAAGLGLSRAESFWANDSATCALDLVANVRLGPNMNTAIGGKTRGELRGSLRFAIGDNVRLVDGVLKVEDSVELSAVGQVAGPALTVRVTVPLGGTLVMVGAGEKAMRSCNGAVDGLFTGPDAGDLGDWHAVATKIGEGPAAVQSTEAPATVPTNQSGSNNSPSATHTLLAETATTAATEQPTEAPTQPPIESPTTAPTFAMPQATFIPPPTSTSCVPSGICSTSLDCCGRPCDFTLGICM